MADAQQYTFTQARTRLEDIVTQVRRKDVSLEKSLDLLEEGVRLANACTELIDHTEWRAVAAEQEAEDAVAEGEAADSVATDDATGEGEAAAEFSAETEAEADSDAEAVAVVDEVAPDAAEICDSTVTVIEVDEDGAVHVEVAEGEYFAEADEAWPDDDAFGEEPSGEDEPAGV